MRSKKLIDEAEPCDMDFTNQAIQTPSDFLKNPKAICSNCEQCTARSKLEGIMCYAGMAVQVARFVLDSSDSIETALSTEREELLSNPSTPNGKFWVLRDGEWLIVEVKENVIDNIIEFAKVIISQKPGERRPFTNDGKRIETGLDAAMENALTDIKDCMSEVPYDIPVL